MFAVIIIIFVVILLGMLQKTSVFQMSLLSDGLKTPSLLQDDLKSNKIILISECFHIKMKSLDKI